MSTASICAPQRPVDSTGWKTSANGWGDFKKKEQDAHEKLPSPGRAASRHRCKRSRDHGPRMHIWRNARGCCRASREAAQMCKVGMHNAMGNAVWEMPAAPGNSRQRLPQLHFHAMSVFSEEGGFAGFPLLRGTSASECPCARVHRAQKKIISTRSLKQGHLCNKVECFLSLTRCASWYLRQQRIAGKVSTILLILY